MSNNTLVQASIRGKGEERITLPQKRRRTCLFRDICAIFPVSLRYFRLHYEQQQKYFKKSDAIGRDVFFCS